MFRCLSRSAGETAQKAIDNPAKTSAVVVYFPPTAAVACWTELLPCFAAGSAEDASSTRHPCQWLVHVSLSILADYCVTSPDRFHNISTSHDLCFILCRRGKRSWVRSSCVDDSDLVQTDTLVCKDVCYLSNSLDCESQFTHITGYLFNQNMSNSSIKTK